MKNKYLTKCFCITLFSAMASTSPMAVCASEETFESEIVAEKSEEVAAIISENDNIIQKESPSVQQEEITITPTPKPDGREEVITPTPKPDGREEVITPTPEPDGREEVIIPTPEPDGEGEEIITSTPEPDGEGEEVITPTPEPDGEGEEVITPTPEPDGEGEEVITPTPEPDGEGEEVITPTPEPDEGEEVITPTPEPDGEGEEVITPTPEPDEGEDMITPIPEPDGEEEITNDVFGDTVPDVEATPSIIMPSTILTSTPVYYTNMVSNLHAGKEFYLNSLKTNYQITFSEGFASVLEAIEKEYKEKYKISDLCDKRTDGLTTSEDMLLVRNWQDIIAIYIYEKSKEGYTEFYLNELCKDDLARIFEEMNPIARDKSDITRVSYANRHINYYMKEHNISKEDREILKKYVEADCKLLCAVVTGAKGLVRQSVGEDVSEERVNVITAAYSLIGEVGYFWGGKSNSVGKNANWGTAEFVTASGSSTTGTLRAYGLDCSGFVSWAVINGYKNSSMLSNIGEGTSNQWTKAKIISEAEAQPGDLVFQRGPESGENNHVGIICGQTEDGDWIVVHCSSSKNGVTVGEAYSAGFRYIRQPSIYPSDEQVSIMNGLYGYTDSSADSEVFVSDDLQSLISQIEITSGENGFTTDSSDAFMDDIEISVFEDGMVIEDIEIFGC